MATSGKKPKHYDLGFLLPQIFQHFITTLFWLSAPIRLEYSIDSNFGVVMQYRCPQCQSPKIMPVAQAGAPATRPVVPKSLVFWFQPFLYYYFWCSLASQCGCSGMALAQHYKLQRLWFSSCVIAGFLFYRDLPDFKISMQGFMQSQKKWKCRECDHEWEI
jgi:hypothetical protein